MKLLNVQGKINVFPENRNRLKKEHKRQTVVVNVSNDISYYYSSFMFKKYGILLTPPEFGAHVSLIKCGSEIESLKPEAFEYLKSLDNTYITMQYSVDLYRHWEFFALPVYSDKLNSIRSSIGLPTKSYFHITIGRVSPLSKQISLLNREIP